MMTETLSAALLCSEMIAATCILHKGQMTLISCYYNFCDYQIGAEQPSSTRYFVVVVAEIWSYDAASDLWLSAAVISMYWLCIVVASIDVSRLSTSRRHVASERRRLQRRFY